MKIKINENLYSRQDQSEDQKVTTEDYEEMEWNGDDIDNVFYYKESEEKKREKFHKFKIPARVF